MISENSWKLRLTVLLVLVQGAQSSFCPLYDGVVQMCQQDSVLGNYLHIDTRQVPNNTAVHCVCDVVLADGVVVEYLDLSGPDLDGDLCGTRFTFNDGSILQCISSSRAVGTRMDSIHFTTTNYATIAACLTLKIGGTTNATINCYSHDRTTVTPTLTQTVASPINTTSTLTHIEARTTTTTRTTTLTTTTTTSAAETTTAATRTTTSTTTTAAAKTTTTTTSYRSTSSTPQTSTFQTPTSSTPSTRTTTLITTTLITLITSPVTRDLQQSGATTASTTSEEITTSQGTRTSQPSTITTTSATTVYITTTTNTTATLTTRSTLSETSPTSDEATTLRSETSRYDTTLGDEQSSTTNQGTSPKSNVSTIESEATSAITEGMVSLHSTTLSTSPSPSRSPTPLLSTFTRTLISTTTTTTPLTPSTTISTSSLKSTQRLSEAAVVGFVIAAGAVGVILLILLVFVCRTRQKNTENGKVEGNQDTDSPDVPIVVHVTAPGTDELYAIVNKRYGIRAMTEGPVMSPLPVTSNLTPDSSKHRSDGTGSRHSDGGQPDDTNTDTYIPLSSYDKISSYSTNNADDSMKTECFYSAAANYTDKQETSEETSMEDDIETLYSFVSKKSLPAHHSNTLKMSETDETTEGNTKHPDCNTLETDRNIRQMEEKEQVTEGRSYGTEGTAQGTDNTTSTLWRYTGDGGQWYFSEIM